MRVHNKCRVLILIPLSSNDPCNHIDKLIRLSTDLSHNFFRNWIHRILYTKELKIMTIRMGIFMDRNFFERRKYAGKIFLWINWYVLCNYEKFRIFWSTGKKIVKPFCLIGRFTFIINNAITFFRSLIKLYFSPAFWSNTQIKDY